MNGIEAARIIKSRPDPPKVIIVTLYDNAGYRNEGKAAGIDGFVSKSEFGARLLPLIHALFGGGTA
jgi:DNA-binding NarL/FixJ family response regulator